MPSKVWDGIVFIHRVLYKWFHPIRYNECAYLSLLGLKLVHIIKRDAMHPVKQNCKIVILSIWHFTVEPLFYGYHIMLSFILRLSYSVIHLYARTTSRIDWMWINHTQHDFDPRKKIRRFVRIILECLRKKQIHWFWFWRKHLWDVLPNGFNWTYSQNVSV